MAQKVLGPSGSPRRRRFTLWPLLLVAVAALFYVGGAQAVHDTGKFQLDGDAASGTNTTGAPAATDDWDKVCHQVLGSDCSTTFDTSGATAVSWVAEASLNSTIFTT